MDENTITIRVEEEEVAPGPETVDLGGGRRVGFEQYQAAQQQIERERLRAAQQQAYDFLTKRPPETVKTATGKVGFEEYWQGRREEERARKMEADGLKQRSEEAWRLTKAEQAKGGSLGQIGRLVGSAASGDFGGLAASLGASAGTVAATGGAAIAAYVAIDQVTKQLQAATKQIQRLGNVAESVASNDFARAGEEIRAVPRDFAESIPLIGGMIAAQMDLQMAPIRAIEQTTAAFRKRASEISGYSGSIAGAEARAEVRSTIGDIREANQLGPGMGRMIDAQSRLDETLRELLLPIKRIVVDVLAGKLELLADIITALKKIQDRLPSAPDVAVIAGATTGMAGAIGAWVADQKAKGAEPDQIWDLFIDQLGDGGPP